MGLLLPFIEKRLRARFVALSLITAPSTLEEATDSVISNTAENNNDITTNDSSNAINSTEESPLLSDQVNNSENKISAEENLQKRQITVRIHRILLSISLLGAFAGNIILALATEGWVFYAGICYYFWNYYAYRFFFCNQLYLSW